MEADFFHLLTPDLCGFLIDSIQRWITFDDFIPLSLASTSLHNRCLKSFQASKKYFRDYRTHNAGRARTDQIQKKEVPLSYFLLHNFPSRLGDLPYPIHARTLTHVEYKGTQINFDTKFLRDLSTNLIHLNLKGCETGDWLLPHLSHLTALTYLNLGQPHTNSVPRIVNQFSCLQVLSRLEYLSVARNYLGDYTLISDLTNLTKLRLGEIVQRKGETFFGLEHMTRLTKLTYSTTNWSLEEKSWNFEKAIEPYPQLSFLKRVAIDPPTPGFPFNVLSHLKKALAMKRSRFYSPSRILKYKLLNIYLSGSRLWGTTQPDSDADFVAIFEDDFVVDWEVQDEDPTVLRYDEGNNCADFCLYSRSTWEYLKNEGFVHCLAVDYAPEDAKIFDAGLKRKSVDISDSDVRIKICLYCVQIIDSCELDIAFFSKEEGLQRSKKKCFLGIQMLSFAIELLRDGNINDLQAPNRRYHDEISQLDNFERICIYFKGNSEILFTQIQQLVPQFNRFIYKPIISPTAFTIYRNIGPVPEEAPTPWDAIVDDQPSPWDESGGSFSESTTHPDPVGSTAQQWDIQVKLQPPEEQVNIPCDIPRVSPNERGLSYRMKYAVRSVCIETIYQCLEEGFQTLSTCLSPESEFSS